MSDLANMTNVRGEVNGFRLLRWLHSKARTEYARAAGYEGASNVGARNWCRGRAELLTEMADDLERELDTEGVNRG